MITTMRVRAEIGLGARLKFEPDLEREKHIADNKQNWDEYDDHRHEHYKFCVANYGRQAKLLGFVSEKVGILDPKQRSAGVYHTSQIRYVFDGEKKRRVGYDRDFVVLDTVAIVDAPEPVRIGDLPEAIQFYPDDMVSVSYGKSVAAKHVLYSQVSYEHARGKRPVELVERGNIYWLYHDPEKMKFLLPADELAFWWGEQNVVNPKHQLFAKHHHTELVVNGSLRTASRAMSSLKEQFEREEIDFVVCRQRRDGSQYWEGWKLQDTFASARTRVRSISQNAYLVVSPLNGEESYSIDRW